MDEIKYRRLTTIEEMHEATKLIQKVWGEEGTISPFLFIAQSHIGGSLLGAFYQNNLVGVNYGFIGKEGLEIFLYSHLLAVDSDYRNYGIGGRLKNLQRETAKKDGLNKIVWTFDPLQSKNAFLNFHKLGAVSNQYKQNFYGHMGNELNTGTDSDRLLVEWLVSTEKRKVYSYTVVTCGIKEEETVPLVSSWSPINAPVVAIPVPDNIQFIKTMNSNIAKRWQVFLRESLTYYFQNGYAIVDFEMHKGRDIQYYILEKKGLYLGSEEAHDYKDKWRD